MKSLVVLIEFFIILDACMEVVHSSSSSSSSSSIVYSNRKLLVQSPSSAASRGARRKSSLQTRAMSPAISWRDKQSETTISVSQLAIETSNNPGPGGNPAPTANNTTTNFTSNTPPSTTSTSTHDPNSDLDEPLMPPTSQDNSTNKAPNKDDPGVGGGGSGKNPNKGNNSISDNQPGFSERVNSELSVLWYSVFMVYVSFVKLIYHNVAIIKRNLTEPGILMIFGIIWELISRQVNSTLDVSPRFNSRIFFYLFLPSTVLESASILSNKWLLLNLLPILIHSIVGTLLYGSAIAFTIYSMSKQDLFNIGTTPIGTGRSTETTQTAALFRSSSNQWLTTMNQSAANQSQATTTTTPFTKMMNDDQEESIFLYEKSYVIDAPMLEVGNLTLADCLVFGSIMSSLDSTTMLGAFSMFQVNEKLYYLVLGETLMNNAVVLIVFNLLLDFLNTSRLTVFKIYIAIMQFFITLIGSVFVGLLLASVALLAVRLIKRFQMPSALTSYQNQCLAMIETLLVLKLAYLTYTLGSLAGLSSIISLATFGVLQDQYIRLNLNLRSQLTFRQVVLATKTMGFSLVYPLLGMLLVDVAYASHYVQLNQHHQNQQQQPINQSLISSMFAVADTQPSAEFGLATEQQSAATKLTNLANQASLLWNFKFLSLVTVISIVYRFGIVILLSSFCNLISNRKVKVRFREQLLMAYGGLKGPLAVALVHRLIEHEDHRDRLLRNKHLFMYTILLITLLSVIFKGAFIRHLVEKMQISLDHSKLAADQKVVLFNAINSKVIECTMHAMNSLMGRSKSPYDRLFEFNESRIKPWLARDGSNTNWLSILYDKLLLEETLDSNCFCKFTEEPIAGSFWHSAEFPARPNRASRTSVKLDTINEHGGEFIDDDELNATSSHFGLSIQQQATTNKRQIIGRKARNGPEVASSLSDHRDRQGIGLKEFVMLDLKSIEHELGRKKRSKSVNKVEPAPDGMNGAIATSNPIPVSHMLSSSSSDEQRLRRQSSSDRQGYISQLERHLESRKKSQSTSSTRKPKNNHRPSVESLRPHEAVAGPNGTKESTKQRHEVPRRFHKYGKHIRGNKRHREKFSTVDLGMITSSSN